MFKVGARVRLKSGLERNKVYGNLTLLGKDMYDTYLSLLGKEQEIKIVSAHGNYTMRVDDYWWSQEMLERITETKNPATVVTIEVFNNTTVAKLREGDKVIRTGVARCNPGDTFDAYEGARLALDRLYGKVEPYKRKKEQKKPEVREVKRLAKVGEWIKIVNDGDAEYYRKGDICRVVNVNRSVPNYSEGIYATTRGTHPCNRGNNTSFMYDSEYVVLEGYEPDKEGR